MLNGIDDTATLYSNHFPEQFRCYPDLPDSVLCHQQAVLAAAAQDTISFYHALDSLVAEHQAMYASHCMRNLQESLTIIYSSSEFLYTLYYYDQADNLIKTVPPEGVHPITDNNLLEAVAYYRNNVSRYDTLQAGFIRPNHTVVTNYRYNSLNQVTQSYLPDYDGVSYVYYDILSRPVLSQDGKQRQQHKYSYTVYDSLGHIVEVGQIQNGTPVSREKAADTAFFNLFLNSGVKSEITKTRYDSALVSSLDQTHLRNRIAAVSFYPTDVSDYQSATHYSYDIHGNVKRLVQEIPDLNLFGRQFTTLDYEYDLISGNVNAVWFQKGELEQFAHRYRYDADNRITHVYTSNLFKKNDTTFLPQERLEARYFYLPDGAMSRVELGHKQIQGIDYAYTLQGWLKDINGYRSLFSDVYDLLSGYDMGNDGSPVTGNLNSVFPWDAFSSSIQYYQGDYQPVVGTNYFNCPSTSAVPLYNGNISALTTSYHNSTNVVLMKLFRYDKLNRIKQMQTAEQFQSTSGWEPVSDNYSTEYEYDWNGNLLSLRRNDKYGQIMHDIAYHYPNAANNRLGSITATGLNSSSYRYDAIGNLVRDNAEGLTVSWNALGKVDSICRNGHLLSRFRYSPTGQRQVKMADGDTVFYIHDATGNVMCVYQLKNDTLFATERYMYGGKRLGMFGQQVWILAGGTAGMSDSSTIGARTYELTDHLGNVTATILDRKRPVLNSYGNMVYIPLIVSYTDYYPFGYPISDRSYYNGGYRYFFNGQEADNEVLGEGVSFSAEFWQYDTRLGRRWNVDPVFKEYESPYACFAGNPVTFADEKGDTLRITTQKGSFLFSLDDKKTKTTEMTAGQLYKKGIQWFEPLADNYMPLIKMSDDLSTNPSLKHFTWKQVADFAEVNRPMVSYRQRGAGDWKISKDGADGYYLVTVGDYPYWSDAIGQIAYAVDYFTDNYRLTGERGPSIRKTVQNGKKYGEGKLFGGKPDNSNTYDNYFILRGALWASKRYSLKKTKRFLRSDKKELKRTNYSPDNLKNQISEDERNDYLR